MGPQLYVTREEYGELKSDLGHLKDGVKALDDTVAANALTSNRQHNEQLEEARKTTAKVDALANTVTLFIDGHNKVRERRENEEAIRRKAQIEEEEKTRGFQSRVKWIGAGGGLTVVIGAAVGIAKALGWV